MILFFIVCIGFSVLFGYLKISDWLEKIPGDKLDNFYRQKQQQELKLHRRLNSHEIELLSLKCGF